MIPENPAINKGIDVSPNNSTTELWINANSSKRLVANVEAL